MHARPGVHISNSVGTVAGEVKEPQKCEQCLCMAVQGYVDVSVNQWFCAKCWADFDVPSGSIGGELSASNSSEMRRKELEAAWSAGEDYGGVGGQELSGDARPPGKTKDGPDAQASARAPPPLRADRNDGGHVSYFVPPPNAAATAAADAATLDDYAVMRHKKKDRDADSSTGGGSTATTTEPDASEKSPERRPRRPPRRLESLGLTTIDGDVNVGDGLVDVDDAIAADICVYISRYAHHPPVETKKKKTGRGPDQQVTFHRRDFIKVEEKKPHRENGSPHPAGWWRVQVCTTKQIGLAPHTPIIDKGGLKKGGLEPWLWTISEVSCFRSYFSLNSCCVNCHIIFN